LQYPGISNSSSAVTRHFPIAIEFRNRCRELHWTCWAPTLPNGGQMAQLIDEYAQMVNPTGQALTWADADRRHVEHEPLTRGTLGNASDYTITGNNFYKTPFSDHRNANLAAPFTTQLDAHPA
jgi:hypothetical protein